MTFKNYLFLAIGLVTLLAGCVEKKYYTENVPVAANQAGTPVTDNPVQTLSFQDAKGLKSGTTLKLRLNRTGSEVKEYTVKFDGTYDMNGEHLIYCTTDESLVVGQGDSGSPLLTMDGKVVGALCYGFYFSNYQFAARTIEDLIAIDPTSSLKTIVKGKSNLFNDLGIVHYAMGVDEKCLERYNKQGTQFNNSNTIFIKNQPAELKSVTKSIATAIPGNSIAINIVSGDLYTMGAIGTLSYITKNNKLLAFGHEFGIFPLSARTTLANMVTMINSTQIAYKMAVPTDQALGCMTSDTQNGILIDPLATAQEFKQELTINMTGKLAKDLGNKISATHTIINFQNPEEDGYYAAEIPAMAVYYQIITKGHTSLQVTCTVNVTFKNSSAYTDSFNLWSSDGMLDYDIFSRLRSGISNFFWGGNADNITDYKVTLDISDYENNSGY